MNSSRQFQPNGSLSSLVEAFLNAAPPKLSMLIGDHKGEFAGPLWVRGPAPLLCALTGMRGWCGKTFKEVGPDTLSGFNLVRAGSGVANSIPISARIAAARLDGRSALLVEYPSDAPFPWCRVTDELRPVGNGILLGLTYGIPGTPSEGAPFILRRIQPLGRSDAPKNSGLRAMPREDTERRLAQYKGPMDLDDLRALLFCR